MSRQGILGEETAVYEAVCERTRWAHLHASVEYGREQTQHNPVTWLDAITRHQAVGGSRPSNSSESLLAPCSYSFHYFGL